jgi:lipopolysaccharide export system protein LptA
MIRAAMLLGGALLLTAGSAHAQVSLPGHDSRSPIEIVSDSLTVRQQEQLAVFSGNVDATQGDLSLRADEVKVFYDQKGGQNGQDAKKAQPGDSQTIRRIEAAGHVVVTDPQQNATGDRGAYDVAAGRIRLEGNVVLTRMDNVLRGTVLDLELATGTATLRGGKGTDRVRALFRPEDAQAAPRGAAGGKEQAPKKEN